MSLLHASWGRLWQQSYRASYLHLYQGEVGTSPELPLLYPAANGNQTHNTTQPALGLRIIIFYHQQGLLRAYLPPGSTIRSPHPRTPPVTGQLPLGQLPRGQLPWGQLPWGQLPRGQLPCRTITPKDNYPHNLSLWVVVLRGNCPTNRGNCPWGNCPWGNCPTGVMVLGGSCPGGNCPRGSCPMGVIVLRGSCPWGSCPQGSCPRGSCPRTQTPIGCRQCACSTLVSSAQRNEIKPQERRHISISSSDTTHNPC